MLIEKSAAPNVGDIVTIKLTSGEEVVGRLQSLSDTTVSLAKPIAITLQPIEGGKAGMSFWPVLGSMDPTTTLSFALASLSIRPTKTGDDVTKSYIEMTSSLVLPR